MSNLGISPGSNCFSLFTYLVFLKHLLCTQQDRRLQNNLRYKPCPLEAMISQEDKQGNRSSAHILRNTKTKIIKFPVLNNIH